jgi:hypothetical protein
LLAVRSVGLADIAAACSVALCLGFLAWVVFSVSHLAGGQADAARGRGLIAGIALLDGPLAGAALG